MITLTGTTLLTVSSAAAVLAPVALALWLRRRPARRRWSRTAAHLGLVLTCQFLAVTTLFLWANQQYGFYTSWSDLLGRSGGEPAISANGLVQQGEGRAQVITVDGGPGGHGRHQVLVWLPRQYDQSSPARTRFPVVMVLPGQPSTPQAMFRHYQFGRGATAEIDSGRVSPFIAVFPPLMVDQPRDTECTDVPGGPQAQTWLSQSVYQAVNRSFRVSPRPWSLIGWSTGAFCSAKLLLRHPGQYAAAAGLGGYYQPLLDHTTGDLFHSRRAVEQQNSPLWLYQHGGLHHRRLLVVTGQQDAESYLPSTAFLRASRGDPGVASLTFPSGGHNYHNYRVLLPEVLRWLDKTRALG